VGAPFQLQDFRCPGSEKIAQQTLCAAG